MFSFKNGGVTAHFIEIDHLNQLHNSETKSIVLSRIPGESAVVFRTQ